MASLVTSDNQPVFLRHSVYLFFFVKFLTLPFSELTMMVLAVDLIDNHCPAMALLVGYVTHKIVPKMTYTVSSRTLNPAIPITYCTIPSCRCSNSVHCCYHQSAIVVFQTDSTL